MTGLRFAWISFLLLVVVAGQLALRSTNNNRIASGEKYKLSDWAAKRLKHGTTEIFQLISVGSLGLRTAACARAGDLCKVHGLKGPMGSIARLWGVYRDPTDCITMRHKAASTATTRESSTLPLHQGQCHAKHQGHQENVQIKCICFLYMMSMKILQFLWPLHITSIDGLYRDPNMEKAKLYACTTQWGSHWRPRIPKNKIWTQLKMALSLMSFS